MKTACILAALAFAYSGEVDTAKAKGPHGSHGVSSRSNGNRYVKPTTFPTYTNQVFTQKPIVITQPTLVQKSEIVPIKTADMKHHLHKHHRHHRPGIDVPDVDIAEPDLDEGDEDEDESCELADGVSDSKPAPSITTGTPANDDGDDDDDDDDDD